MNTGCCESHLEQIRRAIRNSSGLPGAVNQIVTVHGLEALNDPGISVMDAFHIATFARMPSLKLDALRRTVELHSAVHVYNNADYQAEWLKFSGDLLKEVAESRDELPTLKSYKKVAEMLKPMLKHSALTEPDGIDNVINALVVQRLILSMVDTETARQIADNMTGIFLDGAVITHKLDRV